MSRLLCLLAWSPLPAFAGAFVENQLPLTFVFDYDWTSAGVHGNTTFALDDDATLNNASTGPFVSEARMVCANFDVCMTGGSFETGNAGEGFYDTTARVLNATCTIDSSATLPSDGWVIVAFFAGITLQPYRCDVVQDLELTYTGTGAVYDGTATLGSVVFWRGFNGSTYVGTVPTLTNAVSAPGSFSGSLSGPGTGTFVEL